MKRNAGDVFKFSLEQSIDDHIECIFWVYLRRIVTTNDPL